jgi:RNA polymerase sigma-70 factor (ECF subfamily)
MTTQNSDPLETLLSKLCAGDADAAGKAFLTYEPYLRMVVRRNLSGRLRSKFDSEDVVQSVWADLLQGFRDGDWEFTNAAQLRAFLVKVTHNRFLNRVRRHKTALEREQPFDASSEPTATGGSAPSEEVHAADLWRQMLEACPPAHHELLRLKREGVPLAEMAARTGMHESSVRRIFYDLARRVAALKLESSAPKSDSASVQK